MRTGILTSSILIALTAATWAPPAQGAQDFLKKPIVGTKKVLFYRLRYPGTPALPLTAPSLCPQPANMAAFMDRVEQILASNSYGKLQVEGTVAGTGEGSVLTMPLPLISYSNNCDGDLLRVLADARSAAAALTPPINYQDYDYEVVITKKFWPSSEGGGFNKNFRVSYCGDNGLNLLDLVLHEMGHGFKFEHASYWDADPYALSGGCLEEYGDKFDVMGQVDNPQKNCERHFALRHKIWAGWYPPGTVPPGVDPIDFFYPIVTQSGDYTIRKIEDGSTLAVPRGLRIQRDSEWTYYVTYRGDDTAADGQCAGSSCNGALITRARDTNLRPSGNTQLLNTQHLVSSSCPPSSVQWDCSGQHNWCGSVLNVGEVFDDQAFFGTGPNDGLRIETIPEVSPSRIKVSVTFEQPPPAIDPLPVIDILSPAPGEILTGCVEIRVTAHDDDFVNHFGGISEIKIGIGESSSPPCAPYEACKVFSFPGSPLGYESWWIDTACLNDGAREFNVEATDAVTGNVRKIRFRFLSSNHPGDCCMSNCGALLCDPSDGCP